MTLHGVAPWKLARTRFLHDRPEGQPAYRSLSKDRPLVPRSAALRSQLRPIYAVVGALAVLNLALASYHLGTKSMWIDEAVSADHARLGLSGLWTVITGSDPNMGLYYLALHYWVRVFGYSETAVRSMTVVFGVLAVPMTVLLGKRLVGRNAGLCAGLLLAVSPIFVSFEHQARSYAIVVLAVELSSYFFAVELDRPSRTSRVAWVVTTALAVYLHYFAGLVFLAQLLTLIAVRRKEALTRQWIIAAGAVALLCVPEAVFALRAGAKNVSWIGPLTLRDLANLPGELAGDSALAAVAAALICYSLVRAVANHHGWQVGFLVAWLVLPVAVDVAVSIAVQPVFLSRYLIVVLPAFLLLAADGVTKLSWRPLAMATVILLGVLAAASLRNWYIEPGSEGYRSATRYIVTHEQHDDRIIFEPASAVASPGPGVAYYEALWAVRAPTPIASPPGDGPHARLPRIWVVTRDGVTFGRAVSSRVNQALAKAYEQVGTPTKFRGVTVTLYRPAQLPL